MGHQGGVHMTQHQQPPAHHAALTSGFLGPLVWTARSLLPLAAGFHGPWRGITGWPVNPGSFLGPRGGSGGSALLPKHRETGRRPHSWHYSPPQCAPPQARPLSKHAAARRAAVYQQVAMPSGQSLAFPIARIDKFAQLREVVLVIPKKARECGALGRREKIRVSIANGVVQPTREKRMPFTFPLPTKRALLCRFNPSCSSIEGGRSAAVSCHT